MEPNRPVSAVALVDASPVLLLPSAFALKQGAGAAPVRLSLLAPPHYQSAANRLADILRRRGIDAQVPGGIGHPYTLEHQLTKAWADPPGSGADTQHVLDVSAAIGGSTARAVAILEQEGAADYVVSWFSEGTGLVRFSHRGSHASRDVAVDIGSTDCDSPITPSEFLGVLGLQERLQEPYGHVQEDAILRAATLLLGAYRAGPGWNGAYGNFRRLVRPPGSQHEKPVFREIASTAVPDAMRPVLNELALVTGWVTTVGPSLRLQGPDDCAAVFFLSGGWLEVVVAEAVRRALPGRHVHVNLGTTWGYKERAEAETDVTFVYDNCLYLLSCKNEAVQERFFPHLDRFRALVAEFGESRTRPVLLSTAQLQPRHLERCASFEIGVVSGPFLLALLHDSLSGRPDALLRTVIQVSRHAPRAGLA